MKKRIPALVLAIVMLLTLAACGSSAAPAATAATATSAPATEAAATSAPATDAAATAAAATTAADSIYASDDGSFTLKKGNWVIGVSNSYYGNQWRKTMVDSFVRVADQAKADGLIGDYEVQNGDGTVNNQIAQINTFILEGVDAILIDPGSTTALNDVLQEAVDAGIVVVSFDGSIESDAVHQIVFPLYDLCKERGEKMVEMLGDTFNCVVVRGLEGNPPEVDMYQGNADVFAQYPGIKVLATVWGDFSATKTQEELLKVIPSLSEHVDAVVTQCGGDAYGAVMAFETYYSEDEMPLIFGDNGTEFINWWAEHPNYKSFSSTTPPSVIDCALWAALYQLNGGDLPMNMVGPLAYCTQEEATSLAGTLAAGAVYCTDYEPVWTWENVIKPAQ